MPDDYVVLRCGLRLRTQRLTETICPWTSDSWNLSLLSPSSCSQAGQLICSSSTGAPKLEEQLQARIRSRWEHLQHKWDELTASYIETVEEVLEIKVKKKKKETHDKNIPHLLSGLHNKSRSVRDIQYVKTNTASKRKVLVITLAVIYGRVLFQYVEKWREIEEMNRTPSRLIYIYIRYSGTSLDGGGRNK